MSMRRGVHLLIWGLAALFLVFWSLLAWAAHAVLTWDGWQAPDLGPSAERAQRIELPAWTQPWLPAPFFGASKAALVEWGAWLNEALLRMPDLSGWVSAAVLGIWVIGVAMLVGLGVVGSVLARRLRGL